MPDGNGDRAWHDEMRRRMEALEKAHKELEDAFIVLTHVETRMSQLAREQAEYTAKHEGRLQRTETLMAEMAVKMSEMTEKVHFLIDREMKREGGPEAR